MSSLLVLSVTVVLVASVAWWTMRPVTASALRFTVIADPRLATSRPGHLLQTFTFANRVEPDGPPRSSRAARRLGYRDPLAAHRATVGPEARTSWFVRVRALVLLLLIVTGIGVGIAAFTLIVIASGRFVLELLAG